MAKIGILSFAHMHAYGYADSVNDLPDAVLAGVWDADVKRGRAAAKQFGTKFYKDINKLLESDLDGMIVCAENVQHRPLVEQAAAAGKWILCEKPLATTVADAKAMIKACKKAKVGLGTAFPCRYSPPLMAACEQIQAGTFGDIVAASCTNHGSCPDGWFLEDALAGGGATMDHTVHVADLLRWMLGKEFTKVYCELGNQFHKKAMKTDDLGSLHLEMEGGVQVSHIASWSRPKSYPAWGDVTFQFIGTKGVLDVDAFNQKLSVYNDDAMKAEWAYWGGNADAGLVQDFIDSIHEQRPPAITGEDGLRAVEVTVAAYKSAKTKRAVKV
jgi:UDP-N-acetylglucosamine 3-dehydrogenase